MIGLVLAIPFVAGLLLYLFPKDSVVPVRLIAAFAVVLGFAATVAAAGVPDQSVTWLARPFAASFHIGMPYGLGFWLTALLAVCTFSAVVSARAPRLRDFLALLLFLQGAMIGVFAARDLLLFALFWDLMLIPVFLLMVGWGAQGGSAWRYLIYNVSGGLALLLATAAFGVAYGTTDVIGAARVHELAPVWAQWIFGGFALAFLIKTPVWPLHTWMPDTYADSPAPVAAIVGAVQSKAGLYGFITIGLALFPTMMHQARPLMFALGLAGLVYGALVALVQDDVKRIVAYSSLSHLGLMLIAVFSFNPLALAGAQVYIIGHGLFSAALFLVLGFIETREETRSLRRLGGIAARNPRLAGALVIAILAALGLPGLAGFAGELLILTGVYQAGHVWPAAIALIPIVIAAAYMLRLFTHTMWGTESADLPERSDLSWSEGCALAPLVLALVALGLDPQPIVQTALAPRSPVSSISYLPVFPVSRSTVASGTHSSLASEVQP